MKRVQNHWEKLYMMAVKGILQHKTNNIVTIKINGNSGFLSTHNSPVHKKK